MQKKSSATHSFLAVFLLSSAGLGAAPFAYITISTGVAVVDLGTNIVVATLPFPSAQEVFMAPGTRRLSVLSLNGVGLIGTATNGFLASATMSGLGNSLSQLKRTLAFSPEGCLAYVAARSNDSVSVLDAEGKAARSSIATGRQPVAVGVSPDGSRLYVLNGSSETLSVFDALTGEVIAAVRVGSDPEDLVVHPNGKTAYVANVGSGSISVIDLATNTVIASPPARVFGGASLTLSPDGSRLYAATIGSVLSGSITVISSATNAVIGSISGSFSVLSTPAVVFSTDGRRAYATENGSIAPVGVLVIDVATNSIAGRVAVNGPRRIALDPDGRRGYVTSSAGLTMFDTGTLTVVTRINVGSEPSSIVVADPPPVPAFSIAGITNTAGFQGGVALAPGEIVSLFGTNLGPAAVISSSSAPFATTLCGTSVSLNGLKAPLFFVSAGQLAFQLPYEVPYPPLLVTVSTNDAVSASVNAMLAQSSPGLFTLADGTTAIAQDFGPDGKSFFLVDRTSPNRFAAPGDYLVFYLSGLGSTSPITRTNEVVSGTPPLPKLNNEPVVTIGGTVVPTLYAGLTPGYVGLYQINLQLPAGVTLGAAVPVVVRAGGQSSKPATIPIGTGTR